MKRTSLVPRTTLDVWRTIGIGACVGTAITLAVILTVELIVR